MKILVHGDSLGPNTERARSAIYGLALRGHEVLWNGPDAPEPTPMHPPTLRQRRSHPLLLSDRSDLVLGGSSGPFRTVLYGACSGARAVVLNLDSELMKRWSVLDRWVWESVAAAGMCEAKDQAAVESALPQSSAERVRSWPEDSWSNSGEPDITHPDIDALERWCERCLARRRSVGEAPGAFLDRDGTVVEERGYLVDLDELVLLPAAPAAVRTLQAAGHRVVLISNQSGVGRGLFPLGRVHEAMARLRAALRERGAELDAIYFCPHRPDEGCKCRKPGTALLEEAAANLALGLRRSAMVGDKLIDVETAHRAGALGVLVRTGYGSDEEKRLPSVKEEPNVNRYARWRASGLRGSGAEEERLEWPDQIVPDVGEAADWIVTNAAGFVD